MAHLLLRLCIKDTVHGRLLSLPPPPFSYIFVPTSIPFARNIRTGLVIWVAPSHSLASFSSDANKTIYVRVRYTRTRLRKTED